MTVGKYKDDLFRTQFGEELVIVILSLDRGVNMRRIGSRHGGDQGPVDELMVRNVLMRITIDDFVLMRITTGDFVLMRITIADFTLCSLQNLGDKIYNPVAEDEERVISIEMTEDMTKDEIANLLLEKSQQYYHPYNSKNCPRLLDGCYKKVIEDLTPPDPFLVKVTGTQLEYCSGTELKGGSNVVYGQVLHVISEIF